MSRGILSQVNFSLGDFVMGDFVTSFVGTSAVPTNLLEQTTIPNSAGSVDLIDELGTSQPKPVLLSNIPHCATALLYYVQRGNFLC